MTLAGTVDLPDPIVGQRWMGLVHMPRWDTAADPR